MWLPMAPSHPFLWLSNIPLHPCATSSFSVRLSVDTGGFHVLAVVNRAALTIGVHESFIILVFFGYSRRSGVVGSYASSVFRFLKKLHTVLQSASYQFTFQTAA